MFELILLVALAAEAESTAKVLDTLVVTASRFDTNDEASSVSIDKIDIEKLGNAGIIKASDIASLSSALTQRSIFSASAPQIFIRGVGTNDVNPNANPGVAIYLNDAFIASPLGQNLAIFDLESVEILKGPQGTLFGRNSTGGTLIFHTRKPGENAGGELSVGTGSFGLNETEFAFNTGRISTVSARFSGFARKSDGYTLNTLTGGRENDINAYGARLMLDFQTENSKWQGHLSLDSVANRAGMTAHQGVGLLAPEGFLTPPPTGPVITPCDLARIGRNECVNALGYRYTADPFSEGYDRSDREDVDANGVTISIERSGPTSFKSITSYRRAERVVFEDTDASPLNIVALDFLNQSESFTQEFLLFGNSNRLSWQAGVFALVETLDTANRFDTLGQLRAQGVGFIPDPALFFFGPFRLTQSYRQQTRSAAAFGQMDWSATEKLVLTAGLRFTSEKNEFNTRTVFDETIAQPILSPERFGKTTNQALSWRAAAHYEFAEGKIFYTSINRAFKSGHFNGGALFPFDSIGPVDPEFILAYEAGAKWRFSDILQAQVAVFHYDYTGLQDFTLRPAPPPTRQVLDSADAKISGLEFNLRALLPAGFSVSTGMSYLDAEFVDFVDANGIDRSGNRLTASPEYSVVAALSWSGAINERFTLSAASNLNYRSQIFFDNTNNPLIASDARTLIDARVALTDKQLNISYELSARNLTNKKVLVDVLNIAEYGFLQQSYEPPRSVVLTVTKSF